LFASKIIFFSTKFNEVNVRNGPGLNHLLLYKILVKGYPLKEISEFENWKKVQDFSGRIGWISKSQLSRQSMLLQFYQVNIYTNFQKITPRKLLL